MKCIFCEQEFTLNGIQGGQNRRFCYNCVPPNLDKAKRNKLVSDLYHIKAEQQKCQIGCQKCGYNKYGKVLEWHHINPSIKTEDPANYLNKHSYVGWQKYENEIKNCILLCANCHREWHIENNK